MAVGIADIQHKAVKEEDEKSSNLLSCQFEPEVTPQEKARLVRRQKWINRQITCAATTGDLGWLVQVISEHVSKMNLINSSTALHRLAKLALSCGVRWREGLVQFEGVRALQQLLRTQVSQIVPREHCRDKGEGQGRRDDQACEMRCLSIITWSCATLRWKEVQLFSHVAAVAETRLWELKPFELSNMLWAFAKLSLAHPRFLENVVVPHIISKKRGYFSAQCMSTIAWAFGTAKVANSELFVYLATEIIANPSDIAPQGIANTAWAFARVRRREALLFRVLGEIAMQDQVLWSFRPQELSNTVWAFASVGLTHPQLLSRIAQVAVKRQHELSPENIVNLLWAYAKLMAPSAAELFPPLMEVAAQHLRLYKPQEISAMLWAAARQRQCPECQVVFDMVPQLFEHRLPEFSAQALACMVEAYTQAEATGQEFFGKMIHHSMTRLHTFMTPSLCTLFRGIATSLRRDPHTHAKEDALQLVSLHLLQRLEDMPLHNVTHVLATLAMLPESACWGNVETLSNSRVMTLARTTANLLHSNRGRVSKPSSGNVGPGDGGPHQAVPVGGSTGKGRRRGRRGNPERVVSVEVGSSIARSGDEHEEAPSQEELGQSMIGDDVAEVGASPTDTMSDDITDLSFDLVPSFVDSLLEDSAPSMDFDEACNAAVAPACSPVPHSSASAKGHALRPTSKQYDASGVGAWIGSSAQGLIAGQLEAPCSIPFPSSTPSRAMPPNNNAVGSGAAPGQPLAGIDQHPHYHGGGVYSGGPTWAMPTAVPQCHLAAPLPGVGTDALAVGGPKPWPMDDVKGRPAYAPPASPLLAWSSLPEPVLDDDFLLPSNQRRLGPVTVIGDHNTGAGHM